MRYNRPMRRLMLVALALLLAGRALPFGLHWPRMPWHKPRPKPDYCVISLDLGDGRGVSTGGEGVVDMPCQLIPSPAPAGVERS